MRGEALLGLSLALMTVAPPGPAPTASVTLSYDEVHSWGAENSGDSVMVSRQENNEVLVEVNPVNEKCWVNDDLRVGDSFTLYIAAEGSSVLNKCDYKLLQILAAAAEFAENCGNDPASPPKRC